MIRDLSELTLTTALPMFYEAIASAVAVGCAVGLAAIWLSVGARGGDSS
jgi:hypothetical protein